MKQARLEGRGAATFEGRMVDRPVEQRALAILEKAQLMKDR